ncbi:hypothetical protein DV735_g5044, partial [Chaetothyriales sp. CBS 134920]
MHAFPPQSTGNASVSAAPKNYVFVDEHNRHKRLKVMRACEGCRRRKIKCDAATTNSWPCAACTRLKLHCIPPVGGADGDFSSIAPTASQDTHPSLAVPHSQPTAGLEPTVALNPPAYASALSSDPSFQQYNSVFHHDGQFNKPAYGAQDHGYNGLYDAQSQFDKTAFDGIDFHPSQGLGQQRAGSDALSASSIDQYTAEELSQHLGELKIAVTGVAPYLRQQKKEIAEPVGPIHEPDDDNDDQIVSAFSTQAGSQIRIPPLLMPTQEEALAYFDVFFNHVHPYVPVVCKTHFYHQWNTTKETISPLLLEAVFACAGRMSDDPAQGAQWLALASKHEASFLDTPRLSTLQALLLLLKARESAPKKGYYYRAWMTIKTIVSMAKDLDLHEHYDTHQAGQDCGYDPVECLTKTRVWQTTLAVEMMVGGPQGRNDMGVDPTTVDISENPPHSDMDEFEASVSRQFAYFIRNARNIRLITDVAGRVKREKSAALGEELMAYNAMFVQWPKELPPDLRVAFPADGSKVTLPSHFIGNMHTQYHLGIVMLRRPQFTAAKEFGKDSEWRKHMTVCYNSAKMLCRLQEAVLSQFDLTGLMCMQRGINFTIYTILTCVMIHLIAITHPDPEFNADAKDYFVRHMRILERCKSSWVVPETEAQIDALREAFSVDLNKPFELKPSFPYGSPMSGSQPSPPGPDPQQLQGSLTASYQPQSQLATSQPHLLMAQAQPFLGQHLNQMQQTSSYLATPPTSTISTDSKPHSPLFPQQYNIATTSYNQMPTSNYFQQPTVPEPAQWNPTPIINQFSAAFTIAPSSYGSSPTAPQSVSPTSFTQSLPSASHLATSRSQPSSRMGISICQNGFLHTWSAYRSYTPLSTVSVLAALMLGSVKSRNLVPVTVWCTVSRKKLLSRLSIPDAGTFGSGDRRWQPRR